MSERQQQILKAIIEEHIADAQPVGSKTLSQNYRLGIGPAMIRQEMAALENDGWLFQPHTSAGRVPTDKAYRFYISHDMGRQQPSLTAKEQKEVKRAIGAKAEERELLKEISRVASEISHEFSVVGVVGDEIFFTHGFANLVSEPELKDANYILQLMRFVDDIDHYFSSLWRNMVSRDLKVFIGEENPIQEIQEFTVIAGRYGLPRGQTGFVSLIGPRRMDYRKNMALVDYIASTLDNLN